MSPPRAGSRHRPLVLLHGFTGCGESWSGVVARLAKGTPVWTPDLVGHGGHNVDGPEEGFEEEVNRLAAELEARGWGPGHRGHVVGYSLGGRVALGLAVRHRRLFSHATLVGVHPGLESQVEREERRARDETWAAKLEDEGLDSFLTAWEALPLFASQHELAASAREAQRRLRRRHDPRGLARAMRVLGLGGMPNYGLELAGLDLGVRLVVGQRDEKFRTLAQSMLEKLPRGSLHVVPGVGHNVVLESPQWLARFLSEDP